MLWLIIMIIIFVAFYYSVPLILSKNQWISEKLNISFSKKSLKYFYGISAFVTVFVILCGIIFNSIVTEKTVQAVDMSNKVKGINISNNDGEVDLSSVSEAGGKKELL